MTTVGAPAKPSLGRAAGLGLRNGRPRLGVGRSVTAPKLFPARVEVLMGGAIAMGLSRWSPW